MVRVCDALDGTPDQGGLCLLWLGVCWRDGANLLPMDLARVKLCAGRFGLGGMAYIDRSQRNQVFGQAHGKGHPLLEHADGMYADPYSAQTEAGCC